MRGSDSEHPDDGIPLADETSLDDLGDVEGILIEDLLDVGLALGVDENQRAGNLTSEGPDATLIPCSSKPDRNARWVGRTSSIVSVMEGL